MPMNKKVSSLTGYVVLLVAVSIFASIFFIANKAIAQADIFVDEALGTNLGL
jgi:hypothetical protein